MSYAKFGVSLHGLEFDSCEDLEPLRAKIEKAIKTVHPNLRFEDDLEVDLEEHSGECDKMHDTIEEDD